MGKEYFGVCKECIIKDNCSKVCPSKDKEIDQKFGMSQWGIPLSCWERINKDERQEWKDYLEMCRNYAAK